MSKFIIHSLRASQGESQRHLWHRTPGMGTAAWDGCMKITRGHRGFLRSRIYFFLPLFLSFLHSPPSPISFPILLPQSQQWFPQ